MPRQQTFRRAALGAFVLLAALPPLAHAQANSSAPASVPAAISESGSTEPAPPHVSAKQAREADDAYIAGARAVEKHDLASAEKNFARAVQLNPNDVDYVRALAFTRESRVTEMVRSAAIARYQGDAAKANALLAEAHRLDPDNRIVAEHLSAGGDIGSPVFDPLLFPVQNIASTLAGPVELRPRSGTQTFHARGNGQTLLRDIYQAFGLRVEFDPSVPNTPEIRFDLPDVTFEQATALLHKMTGTFAVAVQPDLALIARDTADNRDRLVPQLEETIYLRGMTTEQMQDLANLARNVFDVKSITASATAGTILLRTDEPTMKLVNATYADMLDGSSDVQLDITLYELDQTRTRNFGVTFPSGATAYSLASEINNAISANQAALNAAQQNNLLTLTGSPLQQKLEQLSFLYAAGLLSSTQISELTGLLGTIGNFGGVPLLGVSISSGATVNALLQSSDARIVDAVQLRAGNAQAASFRSGTRYPIVTSTYSSGVSGAAASALAGTTINGQSAASLLAQYGYGTSSVTVPQIQFEDLGLTIKATPRILRNQDVNLALEMKIEALGATALNNIPVLNNRQLTSTVTVPVGQTALLVSQVNINELRAATGFPVLNDLPGFNGTDHNGEKDTAELLIAITPHIVRQSAVRSVSRRLSAPRPGNAASSF